jgi:Flp pilus assembly pilin Flp
MTRLWGLMTLGDDESGQATVEYFLVILAATALAVIALRWLQSGGGGGILSDLFGRVIRWVIGRF